MQSRLKPLPHSLAMSCGSGFSRDELGGVLEFQVILFNSDIYGVARLELALQDILRERVLHLLLDCSFQGPCSIHGVKTGIREFVACSIGKVDLHIPVRKPFVQVAKLNIDDQPDVLTT